MIDILDLQRNKIHLFFPDMIVIINDNCAQMLHNYIREPINISVNKFKILDRLDTLNLRRDSKRVILQTNQNY